MAESETLDSKNLSATFNSAASYVKSIVSKLSNQQILEFYGLYKQSTEGPCQKPKPSWYEITEKQKWEAWSSLKSMDSKEAMHKYINALNCIDPNWEGKPVEISNGWVHHSCMQNNDEVIEDSRKTLFDWVKEKDLEKVKIYGSNSSTEVNKLDESGMSLLHWAADRGSLDIVTYLIEGLKADVNIRDNDGQTPLHYAVSCGYDDVANYLVQSGADISIKDNDGLTAYEAAE